MPDIEVTIQTTPIEVFVSQAGAQGPAGQQGAPGAPGGVATLNGLSGVLNVSGVGEINVATGSNSILISGNFYPANSNPSGFITGVNLSSYATINYVTGVSGVLENQINSLNFWTGESTGLYYPLNSNPNSYLRYENLTDLIQTVKNDGRALPKGAAVYVSGAAGNNVIVDAADYNSEATSSKTLGLLAQSLAINATGYVINQGILGGLTIPDGVNEGDPVWLGETGSLIYGLTNKPYAPKHLVYLGVVTRNQGGQGGVDSIFVNVQNGYELEELHNVNARNPINKNVIIYDSVSGIWINRQINTGDVSGINNYATVDNLTGASGYLIGLINASSAGVSSLNSLSGVLSLNGAGNISVSSNAQTITISGNTENFYLNSNPSGFITGVDLSNYVTKSSTGNFITTGQTDLFYSSSNPSGYITGIDLTNYVTKSSTGIFVTTGQTGNFIIASQTGAFYPASNPSGYITGVNLSSYITTGQTGAFYPASNPSGFITGVDLTSYVTTAQTGAFYPASNPSGFITPDIKLNAHKYSTSFTLGSNSFYVYTGLNSGTLTLPTLSSCSGRMYLIKNRGQTVNLSGSDSNSLFYNTPSNTFIMYSGDAYIIINDGEYWNIM